MLQPWLLNKQQQYQWLANLSESLTCEACIFQVEKVWTAILKSVTNKKHCILTLRITQYVRIVQGVVDVQLRVVLGQARGN